MVLGPVATRCRRCGPVRLPAPSFESESRLPSRFLFALKLSYFRPCDLERFVVSPRYAVCKAGSEVRVIHLDRMVKVPVSSCVSVKSDALQTVP